MVNTLSFSKDVMSAVLGRMSLALKLLQGPALGDLKVQAAKDPCPISTEGEVPDRRVVNNVENIPTRLEEVLPILDSLHLFGGELEPLGGLEDQHNRRTKAKLTNLMKENILNH